MGIHDLRFWCEAAWKNNDFSIIQALELVHNMLGLVGAKVVKKKYRYGLVLSRGISTVFPYSPTPMQERLLVHKRSVVHPKLQTFPPTTHCSFLINDVLESLPNGRIVLFGVHSRTVCSSITTQDWIQGKLVTLSILDQEPCKIVLLLSRRSNRNSLCTRVSIYFPRRVFINNFGLITMPYILLWHTLGFKVKVITACFPLSSVTVRKFLPCSSWLSKSLKVPPAPMPQKVRYSFRKLWRCCTAKKFLVVSEALISQ